MCRSTLRSQSFLAILLSLCGVVSCGGAVAIVFDDGGGSGMGSPPGNDAGIATSPDATVSSPPDDSGGGDSTIATNGDGGADSTVTTLPDGAPDDDATVVPSDDATVVPSDDATTDDAGLDASSPVPEAGDDGAACAPKVHAHTDGGLFCPRSRVDGGAAIDCDPSTEVCCLSNNDGGASSCETGSKCAPKESIWQCAGAEDCTGNASGATCCLTVGGLEADPKCSGFEQTTGKHTTTCIQAAECMGTIDAGKAIDSLYVVCVSQADCPSGTTCTDVRVLGNGLGLCL
jgi:hypothetical protein